MSRTSPSLSTARETYNYLPLMETNTSSKCHRPSGRGRPRLSWRGTRRPVAFFGYPDLPSYLTTEEQTVILAGPREDALGALAALASEVNAPDAIDPLPGMPPAMPKGDLDAQSVSAVIAGL